MLAVNLRKKESLIFEIKKIRFGQLWVVGVCHLLARGNKFGLATLQNYELSV